MASWRCPAAAALAFLALVLRLSESITIDVYRNGTHVRKFEDKNAEFDGRSIDISTSPMRGQMHYAAPFRNACEPVNPVKRNVTSPNWFALIDDYLVCPDATALNLQMAGYSMMIAYAEQGLELFATPTISRCLVSSSDFMAFLRNHTVVGLSPNAGQYTIKVQATSWFLYEKLFIIFGAILLAAVVLSVLLFCCSVCCRTAVSKWRTRGLSHMRVRQLPKRKYQKEKETIDSCSICLEDFKNGEKLRVLPCDHIFHPKCVDEWLRKWNRTCPLCKSTITRRGGTNPRPSPSSTTDMEQSHLLANEEEEQAGDQDTYGATGHSDNPLHAVAAVNLESEDGEGERGRGNGRRTTVELSDTHTPSVEREGEEEGVETSRSSLSRNEDLEDPVPTNIPDSSLNTQQA